MVLNTNTNTSQFIGKSLDEVKQLASNLNLSIRVVNLDDKALSVDKKHQSSRCNVQVENHIVTKIISFG